MAGNKDVVNIGRHPDDRPIESNKQQFLAFQKSSVFRDFVGLLDDRIFELQSDLEGAELEDVRELQGRIAELRAVKEYPAYLATRLDIERDNEEIRQEIENEWKEKEEWSG